MQVKILDKRQIDKIHINSLKILEKIGVFVPHEEILSRLHMSTIPSIILLICVKIYWKFYPITPQIWMENKKKLKELGF